MPIVDLKKCELILSFSIAEFGYSTKVVFMGFKISFCIDETLAAGSRISCDFRFRFDRISRFTSHIICSEDHIDLKKFGPAVRTAQDRTFLDENNFQQEIEGSSKLNNSHKKMASTSRIFHFHEIRLAHGWLR